jgi:predicted TPR repeat methyltransferase
LKRGNRPSRAPVLFWIRRGAAQMENVFLFRLGDYLLTPGRKAEAADAYQKALELRPNRSLAKRGLEAARR